MAPWLEAVRGRLTSTERAVLMALKAKLEAELAEPWVVADPDINDGTLLRYCRGEKWNLDNATKVLRRSLAWRRETDAARRPHNLLRPSHWPEDCDDASRPSGIAPRWRAGWHGCDHDGRPVFIDGTIGMDVAWMRSTAPQDWQQQIVELALAEAERHTELCVRHTSLARAARSFETHVVLVDCAGMSLAIRQCIPAIKQISALAGAHYPETVHSLLIVNAPSWFYSIYRLVERFIHPDTRAKVLMCSGAEQLFRHVPPNALPPSLGGTCTCAECCRQ